MNKAVCDGDLLRESTSCCQSHFPACPKTNSENQKQYESVETKSVRDKMNPFFIECRRINVYLP